MPGSSPENEIQPNVETEVKTVAATTDANLPAESSPADAKDEKGDMLSAVKAALSPKPETPSDSDEPDPKAGEAPTDPAAEKDAAKEGTDPDELTADELALLRPKTKKRIENLVQDRKDRDARIAEIEPKAQQFEQIAGFVAEAGLSKDEVNDGFAVMRDLKQEPFKAYQRLKPIMAQLASMFGEGDLPADLNEDVRYGRITEQRARELVTARSQSTIAETQSAERQRQEQESRARQAHDSSVNDVATAASEWERSKAKSDPSWKLKQPRVMEIVEIEIARRQRTNPQYFPTKDEAIKFSNDALAKVEQEMKQYAPKPRAINPVTDAGSTRSVAKPNNAVEAAKLALSQAG